MGQSKAFTVFPGCVSLINFLFQYQFIGAFRFIFTFCSFGLTYTAFEDKIGKNPLEKIHEVVKFKYVLLIIVLPIHDSVL